MGVSSNAAHAASISFAVSSIIAALVVILLKITRCDDGVDLLKKSLQPIVFATFIATVMSLPEAYSMKIPTHGVFLEITMNEWLILLWVTLGPLWFANRDTPHRWWCFFGVLVFLLPRFTLWGFFFTEYHSGRRPWLPSQMSYAVFKFAIAFAYFSLMPLVVSFLKERYLLGASGRGGIGANH